MWQVYKKVGTKEDPTPRHWISIGKPCSEALARERVRQMKAALSLGQLDTVKPHCVPV